MLPSIRRSAVLLLLPLLVASCHSQLHTPFRKAKLLHKHGHLNPSQIYTLSKLTDIQHMNEVLDNICIPRVVGSSGHRKVRQYITSSLRNLDWTVESDEFDDYTPTFGTLRFENIIAKWNPNAKRYLTLACHYDSKYVKDYDFIGATDSAVPCMQLLNLAKVMERQLSTIKNNDVSLMLLFFDGEEAFHRWGPKDSIYGARHLAAKWAGNKYTYGAENDITDIDKIDILVLLDLIGTPDPTFYNFFRETSKWFSLMSSAETALANLSQLNNYSHKPAKKYFQDYLVQAHIEDDHIPFLKRNVPVLHLIPHPFPEVWHTAGDNRSVVHLPTVENLNKILRVFVASYLNMQVNLLCYDGQSISVIPNVICSNNLNRYIMR